MSGPIVFVSKHRIKEGKLDGFKQHYRKGAQLIEANKPHTVLFHAYLNEEGREVSIVHLFPDAGAMDLHMEGVGERAKEAYEFLEPESLEIYGRPSDEILEAMRQTTGAGVEVTVRPQSLGGFARFGSG